MEPLKKKFPKSSSIIYFSICSPFCNLTRPYCLVALPLFYGHCVSYNMHQYNISIDAGRPPYEYSAARVCSLTCNALPSRWLAGGIRYLVAYTTKIYSSTLLRTGCVCLSLRGHQVMKKSLRSRPSLVNIGAAYMFKLIQLSLSLRLHSVVDTHSFPFFVCGQRNCSPLIRWTL